MISFKTDSLHKPFLFFIFLFFYFVTCAQIFPEKNYPREYFIYPVKAKISIAANFGELRPNHYHMGLDCRTDQSENKIVKAAADGYISRVSITPFGFGRAIYIEHPNGLTTVYGHLNNFYPELEKYVKEKQYQLQSWEVSLNISPNLFFVKQGQFIAYSGNTGGSQGPHCHFEIRDTKTDKVLNPLLFGLPIPDNVPPTISRLAMYDRNKSTYNQSPKLFSLKKANGNYTTAQNIIYVNTAKLSFGISANDKVSGSNNPNGIYEAVIYLDGKPLSGFQLDNISYNETRYVNAHIDYKTRAAGGPYIEHLSRLPGYPQGVYKDINGDGVIELTDNNVHEIKIVVKDATKNSSVLTFKIKKDTILQKGLSQDSTSYFKPEEFHPGFVNIFENNSLQLYLSPEALYDSVLFTQSDKISSSPDSYSLVHFVLSGLIPVQDSFTIRIKMNKPILENLTDKILMKRTWKGKSEIMKAKNEGDWYSAKFRDFGNFELIADDKPPAISVSFSENANLSHASRIIIVPKDNNDEIKNFRAELDGKWLRFTNDKGRSFIYIFDEMCLQGKHELKISVEDEAGNNTQKIYHFTR
ncbi:MAG: M23 family metallopeptidase [Bacteroidota bacterium]|nr:M23 family metallopeptidase [Bacteroidota bacterium]